MNTYNLTAQNADFLLKLDPAYRQSAHNILNALEDGEAVVTIEAAIAIAHEVKIGHTDEAEKICKQIGLSTSETATTLKAAV